MGPNFSYGLFTFERQRIKSFLDENSELITHYADLHALEEAYKSFMTQQASGDEEMHLWKVLNLSLWLEKYSSKFSDSKLNAKVADREAMKS